MISPYGLLRSPWNFNPSPYLARYNNVFRIEDSSSIGKERGAVFKFHLGINCSTYQTYFHNIRDQPLQTSLMNMEDDTHGIFHFTFGGVGGDNAVATTTDLMEHHGFTLSNLAALSGSAQHFFKKHFAEGFDYPINCTRNHPYDDNNGMLTATLPGTNGGPQCDFSDAFYRSSSNLTALVGYFFNFDPDTEDSVVSRITSMEFSEQVAVMKAIANMFPFDGDLASSGAGRS